MSIPFRTSQVSAVVQILACSLAIVATDAAFSPIPAATFSVDFLNAETAADTDATFGPWTIGGYNNDIGVPGAFTAYTPAQHLNNWGSGLPAPGPYTSGEFKGYGYDFGAFIPAVTVNTTAGALSPCCGISTYAPGEVFVHSGNAGDPDPLRQSQVIRYTAAAMGKLDVAALFTQKHTGAIPLSVIHNGQTIATTTINGQNLTYSFADAAVAVNPGDTLDFALAGRASAAFDATVNFQSLANVNAAFLANEVPDGSETNPSGPYSYGYNLTPNNPAGFSTAGLAHTDSYAGNANVEGFFIANNAGVPAILQNTSNSPIATNFGATIDPREMLLHPGNPGGDAFSSPHADAVVRYTVPAAGNYNIVGTYRSLSLGTTESKLIVNGATVANVGDAGHVSQYGVPLSAGDTIEFAVGAAGDIGADSTGLTAVILPTGTGGSRFSTDFLSHEMGGGNNGSFGRWTVGGYDTTDPAAVTPTFSGYTAAQHLDNWGSQFDASGDGPFTAGQFQGYGYDTGLGVPAVTINTTGEALSPCCGISDYLPGQVFVHSWNAEVDPARQVQVIRYTAPGDGTANIEALFTVMHTGTVAFAVRINNAAPVFATTSGTQGAMLPYLGSQFLAAGGYIDFIIGGGASASFDALVTFTPVPEPSSLVLLSFTCLAIRPRRRRKVCACV